MRRFQQKIITYAKRQEKTKSEEGKQASEPDSSMILELTKQEI